MTILSCFTINIVFSGASIDILTSIILSILSAILSSIEMFVILRLIPHPWKPIRILGWTLFFLMTVFFLYMILVSIAF